jgi:hypothetical protein
MRAFEHTILRGLGTHHDAWVDHTQNPWLYEAWSRSWVGAMVNVGRLPYVIPDSMPPTSEHTVMSTAPLPEVR